MKGLIDVSATTVIKDILEVKGKRKVSLQMIQMLQGRI